MTAWLTETLIATSALMLLVLALRAPVRRWFGATATYALWLLPALRMAMPPMTRTVERIGSAAPPPDASILLLSSAVLPIADPSLLDRLGGWPTLLIAVWAAGATIFLGLGLIRYRRQRRATLDGALMLARIGAIRLIRSDAVRGPIAFGILDRVIAVPHDFERRFDAVQRRLALDHELSHHRSGDLVVNHIAFVLLSLQWFNPLAWLSHAAFRFDQEAACDCRVLDKAGPRDRAIYGRTLARAASGRALLFASALDHHHNLHRRLTSMLYHHTPRRRLAGKLVILGALAVALPLTATHAVEFVDLAPPAPPTPPMPPVPPTPPTPPPAPPIPVVEATSQAPTRADLKTAKADLAMFRRDQEMARRDLETASRDSETARRDSETALRDSETARRDSEEAVRRSRQPIEASEPND